MTCGTILPEDEFTTDPYLCRMQGATDEEGKFLLNVACSIHFIVGEKLEMSDYFESEATNWVYKVSQIDFIGHFPSNYGV